MRISQQLSARYGQRISLARAAHNTITSGVMYAAAITTSRQMTLRRPCEASINCRHLAALPPACTSERASRSTDALSAQPLSAHDDLRWWADRVREWQGVGRDVFVYFNNDGGGNAVRNALTLKGMVGA